MRRDALLIGINDCGKDSGLPPLRFAEHDALELATCLEERCEFRTVRLLASDATRDAVEDAVAKFRRGDTFVFFFAGHGQLVKGQYVLHPFGSMASGQRTLPVESLFRHWQEEAGYDNVLIILDACRAEAAAGTRGGSTDHPASTRDLRRIADRADRWVEMLYACSEGQVSHEVEEFKHGLFTHALLKVLRLAKGQVDSNRLAGAAADLMRQWCKADALERNQIPFRYHRPSEEHRIILVGGDVERFCPSCGKPAVEGMSFPCRLCGRGGFCDDHFLVTEGICTECAKRRPPMRTRPSVVVSPAPPARPSSRVTRPSPSPREWASPSCGMKFVRIPPGEFVMGCATKGASGDERPEHRIQITRGFYMGVFPVTQAEWERVMGRDPSCFNGEMRPVECVTWTGVQDFLRRLGHSDDRVYRLPTEAEWEYAARAGVEGAYCFGDDKAALTRYGWYRANADAQTHDVGLLQPNTHGLHDLHGNVWEWCGDWFGPYRPTPSGDPTGPKAGAKKVVRGGSWLCDAWSLRLTARGAHPPAHSHSDIGFRCVCEV